MLEVFAKTPEKSSKCGLSLSSFQPSEVPTEELNEDIDLVELQDKFVKIFSDVMEAIIGAIFLDSGDFKRTEIAVRHMLQSRLISAMPLKDHERTKTLNLFNSKPYARVLKLTYSM